MWYILATVTSKINGYSYQEAHYNEDKELVTGSWDQMCSYLKIKFGDDGILSEDGASLSINREYNLCILRVVPMLDEDRFDGD